MIGQAGSPVDLPVEYRNGAGVLVDPPDPLLAELIDPNGVDVLAGVIPDRLGVGRYHHVWDAPADAVIGAYVVRWTGTIDGVLVEGDDELDLITAGEAGSPIYGTTVDDVRNLLPHRRIAADTRPTEAAVAGFIGVASSWIANRLGDTSHLTAAELADLQANARGLAAMGAAGLTELAANPELAGPADTSYGTWLWQQFLAGIDEALEAVNKPTDPGAGGGETPLADVPAIMAPDPMFYRDTGF